MKTIPSIMKTDKVLLGKLVGCEYRAIVYRKGKNRKCRHVIDFANRTFMEAIYYLEETFSFPKEEIEYI